MLKGTREARIRRSATLFAHNDRVCLTAFKHLISFAADVVKSSEDEEDDESSSEENKLSSEMSTSNEKLNCKLLLPLWHDYLFCSCTD